MKALPDKVKKAKTAGFWSVMLKLAALDPSIADNVKRVAKRMGVDPPSASELENMFPKGWESASSGSWQAQLEKSDWLRDANSAKMHAKDVAAGRARPGSSRTSAGRGWTSTSVSPGVRVARGITRSNILYPLGGLLALHAASKPIGKKSRSVSRRAKAQGASKEDIAKAIQDTTGRGAAWGSLGGGLLGTAIPLIANLPAIKSHGLKHVLKNPWVPLSMLSTGLYSVPYGTAAGAGIGSQFLEGTAKRRGLLKASAEEEPAIPDNYITKRLAVPGAVFGGASGALDAPMQVVLKRLEKFKNLKTKPPVGNLFRNMPAGTSKKSSKKKPFKKRRFLGISV
jgi:hypothetical protein